MSPEQWITRASLYELLAQSYLYTSEELAGALTSGEYIEALREILSLNELAVPEDAIQKGVLPYHGRDTDEVFHELRRDYTRVFIGRKDPLVFPYGGAWYALEREVKPLMFVGKESMAVERFMRRCGVGQPEGTNEPLDHIASELEFLQYLCLLKADAALPAEGAEIKDTDYADFYNQHFRWFAELFAKAAIEECQAPFFKAASHVLLSLPEQIAH